MPSACICRAHVPATGLLARTCLPIPLISLPHPPPFTPLLYPPPQLLLEREVDRLDMDATSQRDHFLTLSMLHDTLVSSIATPHSSLPFSNLTSQLLDLQTSNPQDFFLYNLGAVAAQAMIPHLQALISTWEPLTEPTALVEPLRQARAVV